MERNFLVRPIKSTYWPFFIFCMLLIPSFALQAQTSLGEIRIKNNSSVPLVEYMLEMPINRLKLLLGNYTATVNGLEVPVELTQKLDGSQVAIIPVSQIQPGQTLTIPVKKGIAEAYPKRTYAELSHKIGGKLVNNKYEGGYSWIRTDQMSLPGDFRDHSYYIKYEGPGWENDKTAFRFYLDNRNAIDVYGKSTSGLVLPAVGVDGYDNYHKPSFWGMDNLTVGAALGLGSIAVWDGSNAVRVEEKDSVRCRVVADGKIRSQIKTNYYGWKANGVKCNLTSLITIDAGSRASHMELYVDQKLDNIATGITKDKNAELIINHSPENNWSYIATFGKQSQNHDMQGLVIFVRSKQVKEITEDKLSHVLVLTPEKGYVDYYFMPTWELDATPVRTKAEFMYCIDEVLNRLNHPVSVQIGKK